MIEALAPGHGVRLDWMDPTWQQGAALFHLEQVGSNGSLAELNPL